MNYDLHRPCGDCPLRREGGIKLTPERIEEISHLMLRANSGGFACHRTTVEINGDMEEHRDSKHCAGALIYAEKQEASTQMMRIAERLGMYDHRKLKGHSDVWDSEEEWLENGAW